MIRTNIFAKILRGEAPCVKVYEDDLSLAFMDVMPRADGHTLVIPKVPARTLFDIDPGALARFMPTVQKLGRAAMARHEGRRTYRSAIQRNGERSTGLPSALSPSAALERRRDHVRRADRSRTPRRCRPSAEQDHRRAGQRMTFRRRPPVARASDPDAAP